MKGIATLWQMVTIPMRQPRLKNAIGILVCALLAALLQWAPGNAQDSPDREATQSTSARLREKGWWPTKRDPERSEFAGTDACVDCHREQALTQLQTPMAHAAWRAAESEVLRSHQRILQSTPAFGTEIWRDRKGSTYTVARGGDQVGSQILWAMGDDVMGQTFILQEDGVLFESQFSYFKPIEGLDLTPGHSRASGLDLRQALGVPLSDETAQQCFRCHTTASSVRGRFDESKAIPGVTCEACHGPGVRHVKAMRDKKDIADEDAMLDPQTFGPVKLADFCGACHRTPPDVVAAKDFLPINIRFQPYRLAKSRCWSRPDRRITCVACHNPHQDLQRDVRFYDAKCLACHSRGTGKAGATSVAPAQVNNLPVCRVSSHDCVSCHMPKYTVPQMHGSFTDHDIRIVRPGDEFPL
jgi:hypothetical protein